MTWVSQSICSCSRVMWKCVQLHRKCCAHLYHFGEICVWCEFGFLFSTARTCGLLFLGVLDNCNNVSAHGRYQEYILEREWHQNRIYRWSQPRLRLLSCEILIDPIDAFIILWVSDVQKITNYDNILFPHFSRMTNRLWFPTFQKAAIKSCGMVRQAIS